MKKWGRIRKKIRASRGRRRALGFLFFLSLVALFADALANDRPLVAKYKEEVRWPVFRAYAEDLGWLPPYDDLPGRKWTSAQTEWAWWPPVPYAPTTLDRANINFRSPFGEQDVKSLRWRHWLGTDNLGRDVLSALIHGCRTALMVGLVAMSVALLIGLLVGGLAGYFGDDVLYRTRLWNWSTFGGLTLGLIYGFSSLAPFWGDSLWASLVALPVAILVCVGLLRILLGFLARFSPWWHQSQPVRIDFLALRLIEIFNSIPTLVLLIVAIGIIPRPTVLLVMVIIGLVRWTGIARFVRAELLKIRQLPYVKAARLSGLSHWRVLLRHALPNALGPVIVALAFGMAGAILLEAFLAFLGLGLPTEVASWGRLLSASRSQPSAWWLAVFPGMAIFLTVLSLNVLGEALREEE